MEFHEVAAIFPMMNDEEYQALVADIRENGLREPVWLYEQKIIDGRNRYRACGDLGRQPECREWDGKGSLVSFVVSLNLKRRHLTSSQKAMVALEVEKYLSEEAKQNMSLGGGDKKSGLEIFLNPIIEPVHAAKQAAAITGTNQHYITDAKRIVEQAPELKEKVLNGTLTIPDAKKVSTLPQPNREAVMHKIAKATKPLKVKDAITMVRQEEKVEQAKTVVVPVGMKLLHRDFRTCEHELAGVSADMIFTDPPYHEAHLGLWSDLGALAARTLKPGGILLAYSGQIFLPQVLNCLSEHLDYCWLLGVQHTGGHIQIWKHSLWNDWKPIVMFSKGKPAEHDWLMDLYRGDKGDKQDHEWSQGEGEAAYFIEKLTKPGDLIIDPMCGSGTILRAAHKLGRQSIGMEIDAQRYAIAKAGMEGLVAA